MRVLVVDDQSSARQYMRTMLDGMHGVSIHDFEDAAEALAWSEHARPDLVFLDYRMPGMDGMEFTRRFFEQPNHRSVPIVLVTADGDEPLRLAALDAGISDIVRKPVSAPYLRARCRNLLEQRKRTNANEHGSLVLEQRYWASVREIEERERETLVGLVRAMERRDGTACGHLQQVARFAGLIAEGMGLGDEIIRDVELAAPLHDLGKIAIVDAIVLKRGPLSVEETAVMRQHPQIGYELLCESNNRLIRVASLIALRHHERFDGDGYPGGLAGSEIPLHARIVAVADVLDTLLSARPYKLPWCLDRALDYLREQRGGHFDPACVDALLADEVQVAAIAQATAGDRLPFLHVVPTDLAAG